MMIHPVQASATQTEIMTKGGNACYYRDRSSGTSLVAVTVQKPRIGTDDREEAICDVADSAGLERSRAFGVPGQV